MLCQDIIFTSFGILLIFVTVAGSCGVPPTVTDATYSPVKSDYADGEGVTYTCDTGYTQDSGDLTLTCDNSTGNWDGTPLSCKLVTCEEEVVSYSSKLPDQSTYDFNTTVVYTCEPGYEHSSGNLSITCMDSGSWSGPAPVCTIVICAAPASVPNSSIAPNETSYDYNTSIIYTCEVGYEHTSGNLTRTCTASSTWSGTAPTCSFVTCAAPASVPNSSRAPNQALYDYSTNIVYTCDMGYEHTSGNLTRTCTTSSNWSGNAPTCSIVTCAAPASVPNSSKTPNQASYDYNIDIEYTCDVGYEHTSGNLTRTCTASSTWSGTAPICSIVTCAAPASVPNSSKTPNQASYDYNIDIEYTCDVGYEHTSGNLTRTCTASSTWSGTAPICSIVTCAAPGSVPNSSKTPNQASYDYNIDIEYTCDVGYEHTSGNLTRTCTASSTWSGTAPICSIVTCAAPASIPNSSKTPNQASYDYNINIIYTCDVGYEHTSGNLTKTCTASRQWSGTASTCTIMSCAAPASVPNSSKTSNQASYDNNTNIIYTCGTGYEHTSGYLTRICTASSTWSGTAPSCSIVTCAAPASVPDSSSTPNQSFYDYNTSIAYTCDVGYEHISGNLTRTCTASSTWSGTAPTCTIVTCAAPASVPNSSKLPNQASYDYNTNIVYTCDVGYEHSSGNLTRTCTANSTWSGTAPACSIVTCAAPADVPNSSKTPNQTSYDYNTNIAYTCGEGFERTSGDLTRTCTASSTWSGVGPICTVITCAEENIPNSSKLPDLTTYAYNATVDFTCVTGHEHTSGDLERTCTGIDTWSGSAPVCSIVTCGAVTVSDSSKLPDQASHDYNTDITYTCNTGYEHTSGNLTRTCTANGTWSGYEPVCTIVTCAAEDAPYASKSPNQTEYDYNTIVVYTCEVGYDHTSGNLSRTCTASRAWTGIAPTCTLVTCAEEVVGHSSKTPDQAIYNYSAIVEYVCDTGYESTGGALSRMCTASGTWTGTSPVCSIKTCAKVNADHASADPDQTDYDYNTDVTYSCDLAYNHTAGNLTRTCNASAEWTGTLPTCERAACIEENGTHVTFSPSTATTLHNFGDVITYSCELGYNVSTGDETRTCQSGTGQWTGTALTCTIVTCDLPTPVDHATVTPNDAEHDYDTSITYTCDLSYNNTSGDLVRTCQADGQWSGDAPVCTVVACIQEGTDNSTFSPDSPSTLHNFGDVLTYTCDIGYNYSTGDLVRTCQAGTGQWTGELPTCLIVTCSQPAAPAFTSISPIQSGYIYLSVLTYTCDLGYNRTSGDETRTCDENAHWTGNEANCTLVTCDPPAEVSHSSVEPDLSQYDYNTMISYTCEFGYYKSSGDFNRTCNEFAQWTNTAPVCSIVTCPRTPEPYSTMNPDQPTYNFNTTVEYTCIIGYNLTGGDSVRTCLHTGVWDSDPPVCTIVTCSQPASPAFTSISPIQSEYIYLSVLTYTCDLGYNRTNGDETRTCDENAHWTGTEASCTLVTCDPPAEVSHSSMVPDLSQYDYNTMISYTCEFGYYKSSGDFNRTCNEFAQWTNTAPVCSIVTCPRTPEPYSTMSPDQPTYNFNTTVEYTCIIGYNLTGGDSVRTCLHTGAWDSDPPVCTIVTCEQPNHILATLSPDQSEYDYNTVVTYTCDLGYNRTSGDETRTCDHTGHWTGMEANCTLVTCNPPPAVSNSEHTPDILVYNYSDSVTFTCDLGYFHDGGNLDRSCNEHAQWTGTTPACTIVQCPKIDEDHSTRSPDLNFYDYNTTVEYSCVIGYNMTGGDAVRTCNSTGMWTNSPPVCTIVECEPPDDVMFASWATVKSPYVYQDVLTYTCNLGYERTFGDATRTCDHNGYWTNTAPNCTIIHCVPPDNGTFTTYTPDEMDYIWNDTVDYTCIHGYNYSTGDLHRKCDHDKTWSGVTPVCIIITCDKIDIDHMTFDPPTADTHDFGTTIVYSCDVGYNHSYGELSHTCTHTREWTGVFPNCTIITCDPPVAIDHTMYTPVLTEHDWNTDILYTCHSDYHYVSGIDTTTCNETGNFPPVDFDCSVEHTLSIDPGEPAVTIINPTVPTANIKFNFDGMCNTAVAVVPDGLDASLSSSGTVITVTVSERADSVWNIYSIDLLPTRLGRSWSTVSATVFYGLEIQGLQAWIDNSVPFIEIGKEYTFEMNVTQGTNVTLSWILEDTVNVTETHLGEFSTGSISHTYNVAGPYTVSVFINNFVSSDSTTFPVYVLYTLSEVSFSLDSTLADTVVPAVFTFSLSIDCKFPMGDVDFTIDYNDTSNTNFLEHLNNSVPLPKDYDNPHLFAVQGVYEVTALAEHILGRKEFTVTVEVWDSLDNLKLEIQNQLTNSYITNTTMELEFEDYLNAGFEYSIDYGDGANESSNGTDILYSVYGLSVFSHVYTQPDAYTVSWTAQNGHYSRAESFIVFVQNEIEDFQGWLNNDISYIEVGKSYTFEANATRGTNITLSWFLEPTVNVTHFIEGEFTSKVYSHSFNSPGRYDITISASNLISSDSKTFVIYALYDIDCLTFGVDSTLANTTMAAIFSFNLPATCNFPMGNVDFYIDYNHSSPDSFTVSLNTTLSLPHAIDTPHLFETQGEYPIYSTAGSVFGERNFSLTVKVWDTLIPLRLEIQDHSNLNVFITNTTMTLKFLSVPNAGFEYLIDYGDGSNHSSNGSDILYELYSLTPFDHVYTAPEVYLVEWTAENGHYSRQESFTIIVQNTIEDFQAWLDNPIIYVAVGDYYTYRANGTQGTNVSVAWNFEAAVLVNNSYPGEFNTASVSYRYNSPGEYNISVIASNLVNSQTVYVYVIAIYYINNLAFNVDSFLGNTTENSNFEFRFGSTANLPMDVINFNVNYKYGTNDSETHDLSPSTSLPYVISLSHLFPVQGIYLVEACAENILGNENFTINMSIWDTLDPLEFNFYQSNGKYITNTTTTLIFENVPNAGFEYIIDYGDGFSESSNSSDILYQLYDLTEFNHTYTLAGVYTIRWIASNGHYRRDERFTVLIQNKVPSEGYSLEPIDKKYPWINLQSIKIPVNITLNDTVPLPTNATCVFEPDDGKPQVLGLVYNESFFQHKHQYLLEGNFSSSLNCSNEVSWYVYTFSLCVQKYNASFLSLVFESLVPLNVSDTVIVYFHIDNGGFELIPEQVTLDFDFGEATSRWRRSPVTYDQPTYDHLYSERGNYTVTVVVRAIITDTTSTLVYPLRLGIMYFKYNYDIGFINTTEILYEMYGVLGTDTTYTVDFADSTPYGQCSSVDISGCDVPHIFPYWGERTVQVVARNSTFVEVDEVFMTIDNPIVNFTLDIVRTVAIPNGTVDVNFRIEEDSPVLPFLNCNVSMGDPISRDMIIDTQNVTYPSPFYYSFQYIALGRHKIEAYCWNLINETSIWTEIVVTNKDFLFTGTFDRQFSQRLTPLRLSAMKDNEITNRLFVLAPLEEKTRINEWMVENTFDIFPGRHSIIFPRAYLNDGTYLVILTVGFVEEPGNKIGEPTYLDFISPPPHAEVVGGRRRITSEGTVIFDAETLSYDQVFPESSALIFSWDCKSYTGLVTFDDVIAAHEAGGSSQSCTTTPASPGNVTVNTVSSRWYAVTVTVENNRTLTSSYTQYVQIKSTMDLRIICKINCLAKIAVTSNLQLVPQLSNNGPASFKWRLQKESGSSYGSYINLETITETGSTSQSLTVKSNNLDPGSWYLVTLDMTQEGTIYGPAYYEFVTNKPPKGGSCQVVPYDQYKIPITSGTYSQTANLREYNLTCKDWLDEGFTDDTWTEDEPLYYLFFLQYGEDVIQRQILYFDPGATSNLVTFQIGNIEDSYKATAVLQISDVFGDYIELRYDVVSEPYLTTEQMLPLSPAQQLNTISNNISQFDDELLKANQSYDYRTLARKIQGIASVYNGVVLNTSTSISLTPDDLLTLGYKKTDDGKLIKWADYWQMIVEVVDTSTQDFLILTGEKYVLMLHHSITTWPTNRRISIVAVETMSRALNATLSVIDYSNVTAAIKAAECADELSKHLGYHVEDRTFPNTDDIMYAATALRDLIRNCLATLQAVLTPNLPVDPTVEEMRNYLLYIQVFKTEVDGSAPLSLQEQTFLAQKQLQKYHVQKYIKSEASKQALPHLMNSLTHLAEMFSKMIQIGQQEMFLENDFIYVSAEIIPAYLLFGTTVVRPHAAIVLDSLIETHPEAYNGSAVTIKTTIFKHNPYFWGEWADRISSYVPKFELEKAILIGDIIRFKLQNAVTPDCIDATPTYFEDDPNKMIYMLFDRMYGDDDILLFIRPNATELVYQAYFNKDEKPSIEDGQYIYSTEIKTDKWTHEDGYKIKINAEDFSTTGKIWIALRPLLENSGDLSLLTKPFCANITSVNCLAWIPDSEGNYYWDRQLCKVSRESTRAETICECQNPGTALTVGTTFYVPPNKIDFKAVFVDTDPLGNTPVLGTIIAVISGFVLFVFWAWRADLKDKYKWSYALLVDNDIADSYFYLIRVYTGIRHGSGTKSNVGFVLVGDDGDTGIRIMDDDSHVGFEAGSVRNFVLSTRQLLGDIVCLRIWHDDTGGNDSAWFLNRIGVTDLQTGKKYVFKCNEWLDYDRGDRRVDRVLTAQTADDHRTLYEMAPYTAAENHLWMSVFVRPLNSNFTRVQRMACLLGLMYLAMIVSTLILKTPDEVPGMEQVVVGPFRFSMENFLTAFISVAVASPIIMIVAFLFKNSESAEDDNEYLSCCRKGYKGVNDFLKIDKSVLGTEYIPPTRVVVRHFHFLPHFCVYVGWALLLLIVAMATWLLVLFSMDWKQEKSEVWMTTMFTAVLLSIFVVETIKVGLIIAVVALLCNKAYDPPEPYIDVDKLKEITKKNSHFLTKGPFYTNYLHQPPLPDHETLEDNRRKRISNHQLLKIFYQLVAFGGVLYIAYMISFESRDPQSYFFKRHVEDMMAFDTVKDMDTYISWLNGTFVEQFFFSKYFGAEYHEGTYKSFTTDIANVRVGPARLRQLRISREDCAGPLGVGLDCYNKYVDSKVETTDHCIAWKKMPCAVSEKADYFSSPAWLYNSSDEVWGFPTMAEYTTYGGGGYFMKLDVNKEVSLKIFSEIVRQGWIDRQTRVVILEFTLYNLNANLFAYAKFVAEFPEVGGVIPYTDIQIFRLYTNSSTILFLQFFFVLLVLAATVYMLYEICSNGIIFLKQIWNWLDILALIMSYTTIGVFILKLGILERTIDVFHKDKNAYVSFENLAFYDFVANTTHGILVFLLSIRVSRILGYSGKINEMAAVITSSAGDLAGFLIIFGVTYFAYVELGTLLFGKGTSKYRDMFHTYGTLTEAIVGKNRLAVILTTQPMLAEFYYFTFVLFVLLTLATMAAAILNFSISHVKKESEQISAPNIIEVIFDKIGAFIKRLTDDSNKDNTGSKKNRGRRKSSTSELRDILTDFKYFLRDVKLESKEKYRVLTPEPDPDPKGFLKRGTS